MGKVAKFIYEADPTPNQPEELGERERDFDSFTNAVS